MASVANKEIRDELVKNRIFHWEVAEQMGILDANFSRMLRKELSEEKKVEILKAIKKVKEKDKKSEY